MGTSPEKWLLCISWSLRPLSLQSSRNKSGFPVKAIKAHFTRCSLEQECIHAITELTAFGALNSLGTKMAQHVFFLKKGKCETSTLCFVF